MSIEISNESGFDLEETQLLAVARHALAEMGVHPLAELSILIVDAEYMAKLNKKWMDKSGPTDVLAFPMDEVDGRRGPTAVSNDPDTAAAVLGDIVLCPESAQKQAKHAGHSTADELHMLTVHGILHLLGYDHAEPDEEQEMFTLQQRLLTSWRSSQ